MPDQILKRYKLGLAVLGIFTLVLAVIVLLQAASVKQDQTLAAKATSIATKLNAYVAKQQKLPASLAVAGISGVPPAISYHKDSATSYRFCATYKTDSSDFSATASSLTDGLTGSAASGSSTTGTQLDIPGTHHSGANCQTVTPDLFLGSSSSNSELDTTCTYNTSEPTAQADQDYDNCLNQEFSQSLTQSD
jgi:type II secretory pathway pseudopilin PulG